MGLLDLLFPRRCVSCGRIGKYLCRKCEPEIEFIERQICPVCGKHSIDGTTHYKCRNKYTLDGLYASAHYKGPVKKAIKKIKFGLVRDIVNPLVVSLFVSKKNYWPEIDFLTPVPLYHKREAERGFNQSYLIAKALAVRLGIPLRKLLIRNKFTRPQAELKSADRKGNVLGAFSYTGKLNISDKSIGIVDDVSTTRFTLMECAKVLKRNGAGKVWGIVLAHG
jgi:competence protein ComFC